MTASRPAPYPAETRAKGWRFELDYEQIEQSSTWSAAKPAARPWLLMMWMISWRQVPCGSWDNDYDVIAGAIGIDEATWNEHRKSIMRGWYEAEDGRLYHPTITKRVIEMLSKRRSDADRQAAKRATDAAKADQSSGVSDATNNVVTQESHVTSIGVGSESATDNRPPKTEHLPPQGDVAVPLEPPASVAAAPTTTAKRKRTPKEKQPAIGAETWESYRCAYRARYDVDPSRSGVLNAHLATLVRKIGAADAPAVAAFYVAHNRSDYVRAVHDTALLTRDAAGLRTQWATQRTVTTTQAQQADRTQTTLNVFGPMIAEARAREKQELANAERVAS